MTSRGFLPEILDYADLPGQTTRNLLRGNYSAAGHKALDFLLGPAHLLTGGDSLIPYASKPEDAVSGGDLVGVKEPGWGKLGADIAVGALTDPLTYLSFGANQGVKFLGQTIAGAGKTLDPLTVSLNAAKGVASKGADLLDKHVLQDASSTIKKTPAKDFLDSMGVQWRSATGSENLDPWVKDALARSSATGKIAAESGSREVERIMAGLDKPHQEALGDFAQQMYRDKAGVHHLLPTDTAERLAKIKELYPTVDPTSFPQRLQDMIKLGETQSVDATGSFIPGKNYLPRQTYLPSSKDAANISKERSLQTPEERVAFFNEPGNADVQYERNAAKLMADRAIGQGRLLSTKQLKGDILKNVPATAGVDASINDTLEAYAQHSPDGAKRLKTALEGMDKRNGFYQLLNTSNRFIKPAMVAGMLIPKIASLIRNRMQMPLQILAEEGSSWADVGASAKNIVPDLLHAMDEGIGGLLGGGKKSWVLPKDDLANNLHAVDEAFSKSKGSVADVRAMLKAKNPYLAEAVDNGVLDGYVSSEELLRKINLKGWKKYALDAMDMPTEMMQVTEQRARLAHFLQQRQRGVPVTKAAEDTKAAFFDYNHNSQGNRNLRDTVPFAQYMLKAIPQQADFLSRNPGVAAAMQPLFAEDPAHPVPQYARDQAKVFLGTENGKDNYFTGLGLPMESLNTIPLNARQVSQKIVGALNPLVLKTPIAAITGVDPYFQTPFGSYDKNQFTGEHSEFGRKYNMLAGTGLTAPIDSVVRQYQTATADRPLGFRAADLLSSGRVMSVDPDKTNQQNIDAELRSRPDVKRYTSYYQTQGQEDPEVTALLHGLMDARKRNKLKAEAAATL